MQYDIVRDYISNLSNDAFEENEILSKIQVIFNSGSKYPKVKLGSVCTYEKGTSPTKKTLPGAYPFVVTAKERKSADSWQIDGKAVCIPLISSSGHGKASLNRIHYQEGKFALADLLIALLPKDEKVINMKYLYYILSSRINELLVPLMKGSANVSMDPEDVMNVEIPLPESLDIQNQIALEHETYMGVVESADSLLGSFSPKMVSQKYKGRYVTLDKIIDIDYGVRITKGEHAGTKYPVIGGGRSTFFTDDYNHENESVISRFAMSPKCVSFVKDKFFLLDSGFTFHIKDEMKDKALYAFVGFSLMSMQAAVFVCGDGPAQKNMDFDKFNKLVIWLPDKLDDQKEALEVLKGEFETLRKIREMSSKYNQLIIDLDNDLWGDKNA